MAPSLFARKRMGELTPKERGGRPKLSDNNESLSKAEQNRRWENAALAEFWDHPELHPRLEAGVALWPCRKTS